MLYGEVYIADAETSAAVAEGDVPGVPSPYGVGAGKGVDDGMSGTDGAGTYHV